MRTARCNVCVSARRSAYRTECDQSIELCYSAVVRHVERMRCLYESVGLEPLFAVYEI